MANFKRKKSISPNVGSKAHKPHKVIPAKNNKKESKMRLEFSDAMVDIEGWR